MMEGVRQKMENSRNAEIERYEAIVEEHGMVREMVFECKKIMSGLLDEKKDDSAEFLERPSGLIQLSDKLGEFTPNASGPSARFNQVFIVLKMMVERTGGAGTDPSMIENIIDILDRLMDNLENSMTIERNAEKARKAAYEELIAHFEKDNKKLRRYLQEAQDEVYTYTQAVDHETEMLEEANDLLSNGDIRLADLKAKCNEMEKTYRTLYRSL